MATVKIFRERKKKEREGKEEDVGGGGISLLNRKMIKRKESILTEK